MATKALILTAILSVAATATSCDRRGQTSDGLSAVANHRPPRSLRQLGATIFNDRRLSSPEGVACSSCHDPRRAFTGNNGSTIEAVAAGAVSGRFGVRNTPTALYALYTPAFAITKDSETGDYVAQGGQFWDGRASSLAEQAKGPFLNPNEMNNPNKAAVVEKIASGPYADLFRRVFGEKSLKNVDQAFESVAIAIAAFEESAAFRPFRSKFDDYLRGEASLSAIEARGFELFKDPEKGNCLACHAGKVESRNPRDWLFTDHTYDNLGVPRNPSIPANQTADFYDLGLCQQSGLASRAPEDFAVAKVCGAFKVPTLRNVAVTGPYMHNGAFHDLRDVVRFYVTRDTNPERWYPRGDHGEILKFNDLPPQYHANVNREEAPYDRNPGEKPRLDPEEIDAVVAFLRTLTDH